MVRRGGVAIVEECAGTGASAQFLFGNHLIGLKQGAARN